MVGGGLVMMMMMMGSGSNATYASQCQASGRYHARVAIFRL